MKLSPFDWLVVTLVAVCCWACWRLARARVLPLPVWVWQVVIYGASVALMMGFGWWVWGAWK